MADQYPETTSRVADYHVPDPSIPAPHDSIELTEDSIVIFDREDSQQWIWADETVQRGELR